MDETSRIETQSKTYRMPVDVLGLLERWAEETGQTVTAVMANVLREHANNENRVLQRANVLQGESEVVLQGGEIGAGVLQIRMPRTRDELADAITTLMYETQERIGVNDRISALGVARARVYKLTPEYQEKKAREGEAFFSPYEDEKKLARDLSASGGAGNYSAGVREKGDKSR